MDNPDITNRATQDRLTKTTPPMDVAIAGKLLLEVKEIMDRLGVQFFLRQGTCLGAIRDNAFIPWDDDLDLGVILDSNGFTEQSIEPLLAVFRENGYYVQSESNSNMNYSSLLKSNIRVDLLFHRVIDEHVYHFPAIWFPVTLFKNLKEISFIGASFLVPNPPEEYLRIKYGPDWQTPNHLGYAKNVVDNLPAERKLGFLEKTWHFISGFLNQGNVTRLKILDKNGLPVHGANIRIVGVGNFKTDKHGYAKLYLKTKGSYSSMGSGVSGTGELYAIVISDSNHEEVLYEELLNPTMSYLYTPDPTQTAGRIFVLAQQ